MSDNGGKNIKPKSTTIFEDEGVPIGLIRLAVMKGLGIDSEDLRGKPFIGIANSWVELNPGHVHLRTIAEHVKAGVLAAGGLPFEFNVPAPCDGIGNGNDGMKFILAQRDLIADVVECYARSQWFDGLITISSCDKINPGMLMAAARIDIPTLCVPGGNNAMNIRFMPGTKSTNHKDYDDLDKKLATATCATCGSCEIMGTANTFQCLMEVLGMALPGSGAVPSYLTEKLRLARIAGARIVEMIKENLTPSKIMTRKAFENAVIMDLAFGGSTNTTLHLPAIASEANVELPLSIFNEFNTKIPTIVGVNPNGPFGMNDFFVAGGIPGAMKQLKYDLHLDCMTVTGKTLGENLKFAAVLNPEVIRPRMKPFSPTGGTVVLYGNLAPEGAVIKQSAVLPSMQTFKGTAKVYESEKEAMQAFLSDQIKEGMVIVIRYEGPKGAPGMPELLSLTTMMDVMGFERVGLITDGRFSGATSGPCVGHISPEAYDGGPIAALQDGDEILIDIPNRKIEAALSDEEIKRRLENFTPLEKPVARGYMNRYRKLVSSSATGAIVNRDSKSLEKILTR